MTRVRGSRPHEGVDVRVTADDAVHHDDVMHGNGLGDEVRDSSLHPFLDPAFCQELGRRLLVAARELDVRCALCAALEQLQLDRADAAADVEHACSADVARQVDERSGRAREPALPVALEIPCRELAAEEPAVVGWGAAAAHTGDITQRHSLPWRRMSSEYIFTMYRADKFYGADRQVLANISLSFFPGAKIGVLGPNGAGKSTLLRIMAGKEEPSSGVAELAPGATVGLLEQEPWLDPEKDVRGNVEDGVRPLRDLLDRFNELSAKFAEPDADYDTLLAEQANVQDAIDRADAWQLDQHIDHAMDALRVPDSDRDVLTLSGGERRRVALCRLLLSSPPLLLLDEPTNHLDAESVAWLERFLADYKGTVVAVTHDRYFLDNVAGWILELDRGKGIPFQGNYSS